MAAALRYMPGDDAPESSLCWFGDGGFSTHLWKVLAAPPFTAEITFGEPHRYEDRRSAAQAAHELVVKLRTPAAFPSVADDFCK